MNAVDDNTGKSDDIYGRKGTDVLVYDRPIIGIDNNGMPCEWGRFRWRAGKRGMVGLLSTEDFRGCIAALLRRNMYRPFFNG